MKWTAYFKPENENSIAEGMSSKCASFEGQRKNGTLPNSYSQVVPILGKRKHAEGDMEDDSLPKQSGRSGQVLVGGIILGGGEKSSCGNVWKAHTGVQCPESSQTVERIRKLDEKELRVLQVQIAMISDDDGDRPIHVAVAQEDLKLVRKLCHLMLKSAISLDLTNYLRQTPLHLAVMLGNAEIVCLLLKYGASSTLRDRNGNSVLHLAVKTDASKDVLNALLSHPQSTSILNSMDHDGYSALHYAVFKNNSRAVKCFQKFGADMDIVDGKSGRTALVHAVLEQNKEMVNILLECGACIEKVDYSGRSAFELALQSSNVNIIKLLEKRLPTNDLSDICSLKTTMSDPVYNIVPVLNKAPKRTQSAANATKTKKTCSDGKTPMRTKKNQK